MDVCYNGRNEITLKELCLGVSLEHGRLQKGLLKEESINGKQASTYMAR